MLKTLAKQLSIFQQTHKIRRRFMSFITYFITIKSLAQTSYCFFFTNLKLLPRMGYYI